MLATRFRFAPTFKLASISTGTRKSAFLLPASIVREGKRLRLGCNGTRTGRDEDDVAVSFDCELPAEVANLVLELRFRVGGERRGRDFLRDGGGLAVDETKVLGDVRRLAITSQQRTKNYGTSSAPQLKGRIIGRPATSFSNIDERPTQSVAQDNKTKLSLLLPRDGSNVEYRHDGNCLF